MPSFISQLVSAVPVLENERFTKAPSGTRNQVWLSGNFVIRSHNQPATIQREATWLQQLASHLTPEVIWSGTLGNQEVMVEKRLPGTPADQAWSRLTPPQQLSLAEALAAWLGSLRQQTSPHYCAVQVAGDKESWPALLEALYQPAWQTIKNTNLPPSAQSLWSEIAPLLELLDTLLPPSGPVLVHGDPIMHNVLADVDQLTGVIDWEFSLFGDPYYDYARVLYYRDCALAYGSPPASYHGCETAFYQLVWDQLRQQPWFAQTYFDQVFPVYRAIFYSRSLAWALDSPDPVGNSTELYASWQKKEGARR